MAEASSPAERLRRWLEYPYSHSPEVSADGRELYFISNRGGLPQAWQRPLSRDEPTRVHDAPERVDRVHPAPEGDRLVVVLDRGGNEHWQLYLREGGPSTGPLRPLTANPDRIHSAGAWRDDRHYLFTSNERDPRFFDVYELDVTRTDPPRRRWQQDAMTTVVSARGDRALVDRSNTNLDSDLVELRGTEVRPLSPHAGEMTVFSSALLPDGAVAAANPDREFAALVRFRSGTTPEVLKEYGADVEHVAVGARAPRWAVVVNRDGWSELHLYDPATGADRPVPLDPRGVIDRLSWTPDGSALLFDLSAPTRGQGVYRLDAAGGPPELVVRSPVPFPGPAAEPALHRLTAQDGVPFSFWEHSVGGGTPRGTILNVHGGPEAQARPRFVPIVSFLAAEGWRVVLPNVRGSMGYGRTFVHLDDVRKRMDSVRDLSDLAAELVRRKLAEPGRLGIIGGSYGGFMVLSAITTYPDLWGAAVDIVGISNFVTFLERTGVWRRKLREAEYGSLEQDGEFLRAISPLHHADRIVTPLLVIHGENDPRVPLVEAEQIVAALRRRSVPVELLTYGNEGHGLVRVENQREAYGRAAEFLTAHLGSG